MRINDKAIVPLLVLFSLVAACDSNKSSGPPIQRQRPSAQQRPSAAQPTAPTRIVAMSTTASTIIIEHYNGETVRNVTNGKMFILMKEGIVSPTNHTITLNGLGAKFAACNKKAPAYTGPVSAIWEGATMGVAEIIPVGSSDHVC